MCPVAGLSKERILVIRIRDVDRHQSFRVERRFTLILRPDGHVKLSHRLVVERFLEHQVALEAADKAKKVLS